MKLKDIKELNREKILGMVGLEVAASATAKILGIAALIGLGALVGASAAVLWTPKTGKELRREIRRRFKNGSDQVADLLPDTMEAQSSGI
jgi:hypothetical protein